MKIGNIEYPDIENIVFPDVIQISLAVCSKKCNHSYFVTTDSEPICDYCGHKMKIVCTRTYELSET